MPLRVAAISFLNPAPLLYNFEHEPAAGELRARYAVTYTSPAACAAQLHAGEVDLGLIPVAELTPELAVVPGCTIASLQEVRSILLLVRCGPRQTEETALRSLPSIAVDRASRSSTAYVRTVLSRFYGVRPALQEQSADALSMLREHRAALLIGDPALLAREQRSAIDAAQNRTTGEQLLWLDLAALWRRHTSLPWVAAVWAVRPSALAAAGLTPGQLCDDLIRSRDAGLEHSEQLVEEWTPRLPLAAATIRHYLTQNIYYHLDAPCLQAIVTFRRLAAEEGILPALSPLPLLED